MLVAVGWALIATILAVGPERIGSWLAAPLRASAPFPSPAAVAVVEVYGQPVDVASLPGWADDAIADALPALRRSCGRLLAQPADRRLAPVELGGTPGDWRAFCRAVAPSGEPLDETALRAIIERELLAVPISRADDPGTGRPGSNGAWTRRIGLFTGYFEPQLRGSRRQSERYHVPLHTAPADLITVDLGRFRDDLRGRRLAGRVRGRSLEPYDDRAAISAGSLRGRGLELVWVDDAIDAFFLHIQGSGRIALDDGSTFRVGYAAQNGHPYHAIGRTLIDWGELERSEVSLQTIDAWLRANPDRASEVMTENASYVFFRAMDGDGPVGAQGVQLVPERSLAVDRQYVPLGVPIWLDAMTPQAAPEAEDVRRQWLLVAQDVGGAIRGAVRGDVFWGAGESAKAIAGHMAHRGRYWALVPRSVLAPG